VKVVAIGALECRTRKGEEQIVTTDLTYFARLANAVTFADQASAGATPPEPLSQTIAADPGAGERLARSGAT
jgi:hypothetical protein